MSAHATTSRITHSPLEEFVRDYVEVIGGAWDEVEPQVYDLLLPAPDDRLEDGTRSDRWLDLDERGILRVAFDPEALPEHPAAQLASFGTPLIDRLLGDAAQRGRYVELYLIGLNLTPHDLAGRIRRAIALDCGLSLQIERVRPLDFLQAVFWFQATFTSDQKEQEILPVALDLHYGRQVRYMEQLLDATRLAEQPCEPLAEARRLSVAAGYPLARERVLRTLAALANTRARELAERLDRQLARTTRYYADLRSELDDQICRARGRGEDLAKFAGRREALDREERVRAAELHQKSALRVHLRLLNLLVVHQPKLLVRSTVQSERESGSLELVWDPLTESVEAPPCSACERPTFALALARSARVVCATCSETGPPVRKSPRAGR